MVDVPVFVIQLQVVGEVPGDSGQLDILTYHLPVRLEAQGFVDRQQLAEVLPAPGGGELDALRRGFHPVKVLLLDVQIGHHRPVEALLPGVLLPDSEVLPYVDALHPVQGHHVEVPDGAVILRRISGGGDEPALRQPLVAKGLALEELEHHGGQGLGDAVDFVQEEDAFLEAGFLHQLIDGGQNLAHGVLGDGEFLSAVDAFFNEGQAHGALAGVMGDGVGHQAHAGFRGHLLHDLGFAHAGGAHQQDGPLADGGNQVIPQGVLGQIGF